MRNIMDILWKREQNSLQSQAKGAAEAAFALLDVSPDLTEPESGLDSIQRLGQENETFRLLFLSAQNKIDELEKLKAAFYQLNGPLERNLRTIENLKIENTGLRSGLFEAREKMTQLRNDVALFERKLDELDHERLALSQDLRASRETVARLDTARSEQAQELTQTRSTLLELERQLLFTTEYQKSLEQDQQTARDTIVVKDAQIAQYDTDLTRLNETIAMLEGENTTLSEALAGRVDDFNRTSRRLTEVENDLEATRNRLNHTRTLLNETKNERKALADQIDEVNAQFQAEKISLTMKVDAMQSRVVLGERLLTEARHALLAKTDEMRASERRVLENSATIISLEQRLSKQKSTIDGLERQMRELEQARATLIERSNTLNKNLKARDTALAKLDDRIPVLMGRIDQLESMAEVNRSTYQSRIDELTAALETERMARAVAEGALEMARKERGVLQRELIRSEGTSRASDMREIFLERGVKPGSSTDSDGTLAVAS